MSCNHSVDKKLPTGLVLTVPSVTIQKSHIYDMYPGSVRWNHGNQLDTGPPNGPVLFFSLVSVVVVICNAAGGRSGQARGQSATSRPGGSAIGRPTLHGGPVRLRSVMATPFSTDVRLRLADPGCIITI